MTAEPNAMNVDSQPNKRPSRAWYLVPIFFGIVGGLAMYLLLKDRDAKMAKKGLILSIILSAVGIASMAIVYGILFSFLIASLPIYHSNSHIPPPTTTPPAVTQPTPPTITTSATIITNGKYYTASITPRAGMTYAWSIAGGVITSPSTGASIQFASSSPGTLILYATETNAAGDTSTPGSAILTAIPAPTPPTIIAPTPIIIGHSYTASITPRAGMTYSWSIAGGVITSPSTGASIQFASSSPGTLILYATETNAAGDTSTPGSASIILVSAPIPVPPLKPVIFVNGKIGQALSFDGVRDTFTVPNSPSLNFGSSGSFSISLWMKSTQSGTGDTGFGWIVDHRRNNDGVYSGYSIGDSSGIIIAAIRDESSNDVPVQSTTNVNDGNFHHVVLIVDRSSQTESLYIDDVLQDSKSISTVGSIDTTFDLHFGGTAYPNTLIDFFNGTIDQTRIYNKALSLQEIQTLYTETGSSILQISGLVGEWKFDGNMIGTSGTYFPGVVKFYNVAGGGGEIDNRVFKHLPSTLSSTGWSADFDYKFTVSSIPRSWVFVLSTTSDDPAKQDFAHIIMVEHGFNSDQLMIDRGWTGPNATSSTGISISPNTQYYIRLQRAPTQLELSVFSDPARTINVKGSPVTLNILPSDYNNNLNFIQHDGCTPCGSGRMLTAEIDNTKIYETIEDATSIIFQDDYSSSAGWTQIGSSIAVNGTFVPMAQFYNNLATGRTG